MGPSVPAEVEAFFADQYPRLVGALGLYTGDRHLAEELAQEAVLRACRRWEHVSSLDSPGAWTWRVARNLANSHFRRRGAERRAQRRLGSPIHEAHLDPDGADRETVRRAVAALPERQRAALVLRYYLDLSVDETATRMGLSPDAVRSLTKRAIARLRAELGPASIPVTIVEEVGDVS